MDSSLSLSTSCRILTICSSLDRAVSFVQHLNKLIQEDGDRELESSLNEKAVPWTITNKYYSAQVHFLARTVKGLAPFHLKDVPAVMFIWEKGHAYKHHIQRICRDRDLNGSEPEVSLAVRIESRRGDGQYTIADENRKPELHEVEEEEEEEEFEESGEIDEFLSSRGFEFIDIPASSGGDRHEFEEPRLNAKNSAIPSLPRVLDALSTIMWPSMQASTKKPKRSQRKAQDEQLSLIGDDALLDWAQNSFDQTDDFDIDNEANLIATQTPISRIAHQARMRNEMEELRRWLEDDERETRDDEEGGNNANDPWGRAASTTTLPSGMMTISPTSEEGGLSHSVPTKEDRFDDDFTAFVSAPAETSFFGPSHHVTNSTSKSKSHADSFSEGTFPSFAFFGDSSFEAHPFDDEGLGYDTNGDTSFDSLAPLDRRSGITYHSLGSASDLGDMLDEEASPAHLSIPIQDDDDDKKTDGNDDGLPTRGEIRASAQRIFGPLPSLSLSSSANKHEAINANESNTDFHEFDDDMDFDLTHMVSAIQGMKVEISGMENEDDRRKAAARVALGLVYGLDRRG
ncbi:hypothetical protein J3R30DRAFT_3286513 [Lentinula aciculospora]|uniref:Uncharacterized protein n=1 Tax=Lentinula aciculospora TaxID=153920 RepID=A0A9W9DQZ3_9AGAR|nr:hypothetical protein J3R30DRAFT_3286513 [Lentinula aciculospora]